MTKCECGCGEEVKEGRRFISGHSTRLRTSSERIEIGKKTSITYRINREIKEGKRPQPKPKYCACGCGEIVKKENTYIAGHNFKGIPKSDIHKKHLSESGGWRKGHTKHNDESVKRQGESLSLLYATNPLLIEQRRMAIVGDKNPAKIPEVRKKISESLVGEKNPMFGKHHTKEEKERQSECSKALWTNPKYVKKILDAWGLPNKPEKIINALLEYLLPNEYKINVKGEILILAGKRPDFVNVNGSKKVIEFNGCYHHSCPICFPDGGRNGKTDGLEEAQNRINLFKQYGYETLIIWEHELEDQKALINKILSFHNLPSQSCTKQLSIDDMENIRRCSKSGL